MNKNTIEYLAYLLDKAHKEEGKEKAIVFLGAGTSVSAGIPLTNVIVRHIKKKFRNNPIIKEFTKNGEDDYYKLMGALTADERRDLFHFYVTRKRVKLNITNIYLAQLLKLGYIDYIVTVNFDDLILKACTLYNFLPPVYDISNIKTITTTDIRKNSVIYLHGQYFGQWLLNNPNELTKVEDEVLRLFNAIKTRRTWIVIGYSGNDGIFHKIKSLGSFSNELFWVKNKFSESDKKVTEFIETPNINAHKIEGYYADSFFLKLHAELSKLDESIQAPEIIGKPFTFIKSVLQSINEIKEEDELNNNVKKMLINCNERIDKAIAEYEDAGTEEYLKQQIIDALLKENFSEERASYFRHQVKINNYNNVKEQLAWYYNNWGADLLALARQNKDEILFRESLKKYNIASSLDPKYTDAFYNLGTVLLDLAKLKNDEKLFRESFNKYKKASELDPKDDGVFYNWGNALSDLARQNYDEELFRESFEKYKTASQLAPKDAGIFNNWGTSLSDLAIMRNNEELFKDSFDKFRIASELDPKDANIFYNWGTALFALARQKKDEILFRKSFDKFRIASELDPKATNIFNNWGSALSNLAKQKNDEELFEKSFEKYKIASELDPKDANIFNNWGSALSDLAKQKNDEELFKTSFDKYKTASELNPKNAGIFNNWGTSLTELGKLVKDINYFDEALEILKKGYSLSANPYNISCAYALLSDKENALKYLKETLDKELITLEHINQDDDWDALRNDEDFLHLINQYKQKP